MVDDTKYTFKKNDKFQELVSADFKSFNDISVGTDVNAPMTQITMLQGESAILQIMEDVSESMMREK